MGELNVKLPSVINNYKLHDNSIFHTAKEYSKETYTYYSFENGSSKIVNTQTDITILIVESGRSTKNIEEYTYILQVGCLRDNRVDLVNEIESVAISKYKLLSSLERNLISVSNKLRFTAPNFSSALK